MAFYGSAAASAGANFAVGCSTRLGDSRGGHSSNSGTPRLQEGVNADSEIHQKLDSLLTMAAKQQKVLDSTVTGFEQLKETVTRLIEQTVVEMDKENTSRHMKKTKLPVELSVRGYIQ